MLLRAKLTLDVWHNSLLVHAHTQHLTLPVDSQNTMALLKLGRGKDCLARNAVHVDARARLDVVQVDETKLGDEVDDAVFLGHLHRDGEIVGGFGREKDVDSLLLERGVGLLVTDLDYVKLSCQLILSARIRDPR
jgi:hypothetical protein